MEERKEKEEAKEKWNKIVKSKRMYRLSMVWREKAMTMFQGKHSPLSGALSEATRYEGESANHSDDVFFAFYLVPSNGNHDCFKLSFNCYWDTVSTNWRSWEHCKLLFCLIPLHIYYWMMLIKIWSPFANSVECCLVFSIFKKTQMNAMPKIFKTREEKGSVKRSNCRVSSGCFPWEFTVPVLLGRLNPMGIAWKQQHWKQNCK